MTTQTQPRLSKSRFVAGCQCPKLLWWTVHEPEAPELQPGIVLQDLFDQGTEVGQRARQEWPSGVLIPGERRDPERIPRTKAAIEAGETVIFEACFEADSVFCAIDVLERSGDGWTLIEVKSSSEVKPYHLPDVAVQAHVARRSGLDIRRMEVMHLNKEFRAPGEGALFVRSDVTAEVEKFLPEVPDRIRQQLQLLQGQLPKIDIGEQCWYRGDGCAFMDRCWPDDPDGIWNLWNVGPKKTVQYFQRGIRTMSQLPMKEKLNEKQQRQLRAQRDKRLIVEPGLKEELRPAVEAERLGFLDFETVMRAIPPWDGLRPWGQTAAQFSYHERGPDGVVTHEQFLAEGPERPEDPPADPREKLARAMLKAAEHADRVVMYTGFEKGRINDLAAALPHLADELVALREKLWDLKPAIADHVYHPDFRGSFSLKDILRPLVSDLSYDDLMIVDGKAASVEIARLLFVSGRIPVEQRAKTRQDLLDYCERDTFATVRLVARLEELAGQ